MANQGAIRHLLSNPTLPTSERGRLARLWNWWNQGQDEFPKMRTWPLYLQKMMLQAHKKSYERYRLFVFLVGNGLEPMTAQNMIRTKDFVNGQVVFEIYDKDALREFFRFVDRAHNDPRFWQQASYYDLLLKQVVRNE